MIEALQVGYNAAKEGVMTLLLYFGGEFIADIIQQGEMDSLVIRNSKILPQFERLLDSLAWRMPGGQSLSKKMTVHVKLHMKEIEKYLLPGNGLP